MNEVARARPWPARLAAACGVVILLLGMTVLIGWFTRTPALLQILPHLPAMTRNTAACFLLCGIALLVMVRRGPRWLLVMCTGVVSVLCVVTLFEYLSGINLKTGELLGPTYLSVKPRSPGRIAPLAALCFFLGSTGLLLAPRVLTRRSALVLGLNGATIAAFGLAAAIGIWGNATLTALHSAIGLFVLGFGMVSLAWQAETGPSRAPPWLPGGVAIAVVASTVGLWQALVDTGQAPFALLPAVVLGGGCLMAPIIALTVYLAQRGNAQAAALRRSEVFLTEAQRLSKTGSFSWNVATDEITWSEQIYRIHEIDPALPLTNELIYTRIHPEDLHFIRDMVERARAGDVVDFNYEHRLRMPDGSVKHLQTVSHGERDRHGRLEYIGAVQDVTDRLRAEGALAKARADLAHVARVTSLGALTASIAHEVNQPLSGIITNASTCLRMLSADPPNVEGALETARRTIRDGNRASEVIARLRALFSKKTVTAESVDLNEAAREVITLSSSELQRSRVVVRSEFADDLAPVTGDRVQLQQVILNLLLNASDAMSGIDDRPRRLLIRTQRDEGDRARLSVQDAGVGLDPHGVEKLFEAFYTTKSTGMGIGLSVSRSIIESHHGRLWAVANEGPGATFSFSIPLRAPARPA